MDFDTTSGSGGPPQRPSGTARHPPPGREFDPSDPVRSFVETVRRVLFSPRDFFRGMPRSGSLRNPLIFAVVCAVIRALMSGVFQEVAPSLPGMRIFAVETGFVFNVTFDFVLTMIVLVVFIGVYQLFIGLIVGRDNGGLGATFRVLCYVQAVQLLLGWVPLVNLLAAIYSLYLGAFGFREVHSTTYGRAAAVVALPFLLLMLLSIFATVVLIAALSLSR
jgi:hypothetical protein